MCAVFEKVRTGKPVSTSETRFSFANDDFNAFASEAKNTIELGRKIFTLESLVHELSEIDVSNAIIFDCNEPNYLIKYKSEMNGYKKHTNYLSHFLCPFGEDSLLNPSKSRYGEMPIEEEFLI